MRLLVVSQYFWPENFRINDLVVELVRRGHQVTVLTGLPNYPDGKIFQQFKDGPDSFSNYQGANCSRANDAQRARWLALVAELFDFCWQCIVCWLMEIAWAPV